MVSKTQIRSKKAITRRVLVPLDDDQAKRLEEANSGVERARLLGSPVEVQKAEEALEQTRDELVEQGALLFTFRGIGRPAYEALRLKHPPTEKQQAEGARAWNDDTFPAALCAAAAVDCDLTEADWLTEIFESPDWGPGELVTIFNAALEANSDRRVVQLGN